MKLNNKMSYENSKQIQDLSKRLLELNNEISKVNNYLAQLRQQKSNIEKNLVYQMSNNGLTNHQITLGNNKIRVCRDCNYSPLTYKFLEEQLNALFPNNNQKIKEMISYIKNQRTKKYSTGVKIVSSNK